MKTYVEISDRQSGKTTRLIEAAVEHVKNHGVAVIHGHNYNSKDRIFRAVLARFTGDSQRRVFIAHSAAHLVANIFGDISLSSSSIRGFPVRHFFDEFDFDDSVHFIEGAYYCTTQKFVRELKVYQDAAQYRNPLHDLLAFLSVTFDVQRYIHHALETSSVQLTQPEVVKLSSAVRLDTVRVDVTIGKSTISKTFPLFVEDSAICASVSACLNELSTSSGVTITHLNDSGEFSVALDATATCSTSIMVRASLVYRKILGAQGEDLFYVMKDRHYIPDKVVTFDELQRRLSNFR